MLLPGPNLHCVGPLIFWKFLQNLLAKYKQRAKKLLPSESRAPGTLPYDKSATGYGIKFIKKLYEA